MFVKLDNIGCHPGEYFSHPSLEAMAVDTSDENTATQVRVTHRVTFTCIQDLVSATYVPSHLHHILFEIFKVLSDWCQEQWSPESSELYESNLWVYREEGSGRAAHVSTDILGLFNTTRKSKSRSTEILPTVNTLSSKFLGGFNLRMLIILYIFVSCKP